MNAPRAFREDGKSRAELERVEAVVIGASAGGVDALLTLLPHLPAASRVAVLIVVHMGKQQPSFLAEILDRKCAAEVREAIDKEPVLAGHVYIAPPDYHMLVDSGPAVSLSTDDLVHYSRPSVDVLFESAAEYYGPRLLGMVLSGANADGAHGLAAIHAAGGLTVVQRPSTAQAPQMAEAALRQIDPDYVSSLEEMGTILKLLGRTQRELVPGLQVPR